MVSIVAFLRFEPSAEVFPNVSVRRSAQNGCYLCHMQPTGPIRVLLVEDDEKLGRLTAKYLESHGVAVTLAPDGNDAVAQAGKGQFDVVLLDLMLPGKDGLE